MIRIGIHVGGANTDAVVMECDRVVASFKATTSRDVSAAFGWRVEGIGRCRYPDQTTRFDLEVVVICSPSRAAMADAGRAHLDQPALFRPQVDQSGELRR